MRGDFSTWRDERRQNFNGVLHQQGRVLLDADWNAQTEISNDWQDTAGRDIIGAGVAAVPADAPDSFRVTSATVVGGQVRLTVAPGRVWADGLLAYLDSAADVTRHATYLDLPLETPPADPGARDTRDAVVLEVWREEINGFQLPELLVEPALGGPDTTERVHTGMAFRLFRLTDPRETCESVVGKLQDDFTTKGKLTVTLDAPPPPTGDCPLIEGNGYTGFEHNLYRIEIAQVDGAAPMFKWSQFGGGLVGRGALKNSDRTITINGGQQAVVNSGLAQFYLEIVAFDPAPPATLDLGHWRVVYGAEVTLGSEGVLNLPNPATAGSPGVYFGNPPSDGNIFFRLWNAVAPIGDFDGAGPLPLQDGILLRFDAAAPGNYVAGDYWTFPVRAGQIANHPPLVDHQPPAGIHYHRVPLGILEWATPPDAQIEDCRRIFQPLTRLATCCAYRVGDGLHSHGDFTSIQDAVDHLPAAGGEICVLPGDYEENVTINRRHNITIKGCGRGSRVFSREPGDDPQAAPVFHVIESQDVKIQSLLVEAHDTGPGIRLDGRPREELRETRGRTRAAPLFNITLENLVVRAATRSAIFVQVGYDITIRRCRVDMKDVPSARPGLFFIGEDSLIEENVIAVAENISPRDLLAARVPVDRQWINPLDPQFAVPAHFALGGLQLGGACERISVVNNVIARGIGNGITLGSLVIIDIPTRRPLPQQPEPEPDECEPCRPGDTTVPPTDEGGRTRVSSAGDLYDILIERNRIFNMGLNGIGTVGFFQLKGAGGVRAAAAAELITVDGLHIFGNEIRRCVGRPLAGIAAKLTSFMGYGGVSLASVVDLHVRDNFIEDNGPSYLEPVCGIFVSHGEGVEISRNLIRNNGARTAEPESSAKRGARGGIYIASCVAPSDRLPGTVAGKSELTLPAGVPALKVHENIVSAPLGRALTAKALGPVSVVGNEFTSRGIAFTADDIVGTVLIINMGRAIDFPSTLNSYTGLRQGYQDAKVKANAYAKSPTGSTFGAAPTLAAVSLTPRRLMNGSVLFTNNQCALQDVDFSLRVRGTTNNLGGFTLGASVAIVSYDDIGFHNNQCECLLAQVHLLTDVVLLTQMSVRVGENRFKEILGSVLFSGVTLGRLNMTTHNQATHCLLIIGPAATKVNSPNLILTEVSTQRLFCDRYNGLFAEFGG